MMLRAAIDARAMARNARQMALLRPSAIAIHNNRDVTRQPLPIDLLEQPRCLALGGLENLGGLHEINQGQKSAVAPESLYNAKLT